MTKDSSTETPKDEARLPPQCRTQHQILDAELQRTVDHFDWWQEKGSRHLEGMGEGDSGMYSFRAAVTAQDVWTPF